MTVYAVLVLGHVVGSILGVLSATLIEFSHKSAFPSSDGTSLVSIRALLWWQHLSSALRIGTILVLSTGLGFIAYFTATEEYVYLQSEMFWVKMAMILVIGVSAYALHVKVIPYYWGSALTFASWWLAFGAGFLLKNDMHFISGRPVVSFFAVFALYGAAVVVVGAVLHFLRTRTRSLVLSPSTFTQ